MEEDGGTLDYVQWLSDHAVGGQVVGIQRLLLLEVLATAMLLLLRKRNKGK